MFLETIEIGEDCFSKVNTFKIDGLMYLRSVKIGDNSFTTISEDNWDDEWDNDGMNCSIILLLRLFYISGRFSDIIEYHNQFLFQKPIN